MTRYAIVRDDTVGAYVVVPEDQIGDRRLDCFYTGHIEGARKLAASKTKAEEIGHKGHFGPQGKKRKPIIPDEDE